MESSINYKLPSYEIAFALINRDNFTSYTPADITLLKPMLFANTDTGRNTQIQVSANAESDLEGAITVYYDRTPLSQFVQSTGFDGRIPQGQYTTTWDLIPVINDILGIFLQQVDVVCETLPLVQDNRELNFQISGGSYAYIGELDLYLDAAETLLSSVITVRALEGFTNEDIPHY